MKSSKPALLDGKPLRTKVFSSRPYITGEEKKVLLDCLKNSQFSRFIGSPTANVRDELRMTSAQALKLKDFWSFLGGLYVRRFEAEWAKLHNVDYAIAVNSATSGLTAALLAAGIEPGDEVITSPFTFTATATSIVAAQAEPIFADVDLNTYCLDPRSIETKITPKTRAIMPVHILGNAGDLEAIKKIAHKHNLILIEDAAQAPGSKYNGQTLGTIGAAGVFSFQETKNVMTGEGGMIVTNDPKIAEKCRLIRNHGESIPVEDDGDDLKKVIGYNFRMQEPIAALGWAQAKKLRALNKIRRANGLYLRKKLQERFGEAIIPQELTNPADFSPYCLGLRWDYEKTGLPRNLVAAALRAEGIPVSTGFPRLLSENMLFTRLRGGNGRYGIPNAVELQYRQYLGFFQIGWPNTTKDMDDIVAAFAKILDNKDALLDYWERASKNASYSSGRR